VGVIVEVGNIVWLGDEVGGAGEGDAGTIVGRGGGVLAPTVDVERAALVPVGAPGDAVGAAGGAVAGGVAGERAGVGVRGGGDGATSAVAVMPGGSGRSVVGSGGGVGWKPEPTVGVRLGSAVAGVAAGVPGSGGPGWRSGGNVGARGPSVR
jgi:hypothetical protein